MALSIGIVCDIVPGHSYCLNWVVTTYFNVSTSTGNYTELVMGGKWERLSGKLSQIKNQKYLF